MRAALLSALLLVNACACSSEPPVQAPPPDSGTEVDAGTQADAGILADAGTEADAGSVPDGGAGCEFPAKVSGTVLAPGLNNPRRLAADATDLYISESGSLNPSQTQGRLLRLPRSGGPATPVTDGLQAPDALAVDADAVYVLDGTGLWRVVKATGQKALLDATLVNVISGSTEVLLSGSQVVEATGLERLVRVGKDGTQPVELYKGPTGSRVRGARIVDGDVWFLVTSSAASPSGLYRVPLDGSSAAARVDDTVTNGRSLEVTATHFLVTEDAPGNAGRVRMLPRVAGAEPLTLAEGLTEPSHPVLLGDTVYFKDRSASGEPFFRRVRLCAPGTVSTVGPTGAGPGALLLDGTTLLFTSQESGTGGYLGRVP